MCPNISMPAIPRKLPSDKGRLCSSGLSYMENTVCKTYQTHVCDSTFQHYYSNILVKCSNTTLSISINTVSSHFSIALTEVGQVADTLMPWFTKQLNIVVKRDLSSMAGDSQQQA